MNLRWILISSCLFFAIVSCDANANIIEVHKNDIIRANAAVPSTKQASSISSTFKIPLKTVRAPMQILGESFVDDRLEGKMGATNDIVDGFRPLIWPQLQPPKDDDYIDNVKGNETNNSSSSIFTAMEMRVAKIGIGTPPQEFDVLMNFASTQFWVYASNDLLDNNPKNVSINKRVYDASASKTANVTTKNIVFLERSKFGRRRMPLKASGSVVLETIQIGKMSVPNVAIGAINKVSKLFYENEFGLPTDGRMGLMLFNESGSGENKIPSAMFGLVASAKLPVITIRQNPAKFEWNEGFLDGSLTIGSENNEECIEFTPFIQYKTGELPALKGTPHINVKSLKLSDGFDAGIEPREAAIVDGMGIQVSNEEASRIGHHLAPFGAKRIQPGYYQIPCQSRGKLPSLRLEIAHGSCAHCSVIIDFNEYIFNFRKHRCILAVFDEVRNLMSANLPKNRPIIIGNAMLQGKCMSINVANQTVSFGKAL